MGSGGGDVEICDISSWKCQLSVTAKVLHACLLLIVKDPSLEDVRNPENAACIV